MPRHETIRADGVIDAPQVAASTPANNPAATPLRIGAALVNGITGFSFNGQIDEVRLWDAAHAATTIDNYKLIPFRDRSGRYPVRMSWRFNGPGDTGTGTLFGNAQRVMPATPVPVYADTFLRLDGDQEFVRVASSSSVRSDTAITVEAWVRPLSTGSLRGVVSKYVHNSGSNSEDEYFLGLEADGRARFQVRAGSNFAIVNGSENLRLDNHWHHLAGVYDGSRIVIYVDGEFQQSAPLTGSIGNTSTPVYIGATRESAAQTDSGFFHGNIDDVRIWSRALTGDELDQDIPSDEIDDGMRSCWSDLRPGLIARYLFEGDFLNRVTVATTGLGHGAPRGSAERMIFVGPRSYGQGSCP